MKKLMVVAGILVICTLGMAEKTADTSDIFWCGSDVAREYEYDEACMIDVLHTATVFCLGSESYFDECWVVCGPSLDCLSPCIAGKINMSQWSCINAYAGQLSYNCKIYTPDTP